MVFKKLTSFILLSLLASSCAGLNSKRSPARMPSSEESCQEILQSFIEESKEIEDKKLMSLLEKKKYISYSTKYILVNRAPINLLNKMKKPFIEAFQKWNNNLYPSFYTSSDESIIFSAKNYYDAIALKDSNALHLDDMLASDYEKIQALIDLYRRYPTDLDSLINERISLQYNYNILKKIKLSKDETRDIRLEYMSGGKSYVKIITLRETDNNLEFEKESLKKLIKELDGNFFREGKIKERLILQASLQDSLTMVHRELEFSIKNTQNPNALALANLATLESLISVKEFNPTSYGIYKISNHAFLKELAQLTRADVGYKKFIEKPYLRFKEIISNFLEKRKGNDSLNEQEKIGIFKRLYRKITSISPTQAIIGTGVTTTVAFGVERYFQLGDHSIEEVFIPIEIEDPTTPTEVEMNKPHQTQIERTNEAINGYESHVTEILDNLIDQ